MFFVQKSKKIKLLTIALHTAMAAILVLGPMADFHGHEEEHQCAQVGHENIHLSFDHEFVETKDSQRKLIPAKLGDSHEHPYCALCWFVSNKDIRPPSYEQVLSLKGALEHLPHTASRSRIKTTKHQRGPPSVS